MVSGAFLVGVHWFGVPFPKYQKFDGMFWVLCIDNSLYKKMVLAIFVYFFQSYNDKSKI